MHKTKRSIRTRPRIQQLQHLSHIHLHFSIILTSAVHNVMHHYDKISHCILFLPYYYSIAQTHTLLVGTVGFNNLFASFPSFANPNAPMNTVANFLPANPPLGRRWSS